MASQTPLTPEWSACSDRGSVREANEDAFAARPEVGIWAVADGMGGHARGDWAAWRIVQEMGTIGGARGLEQLVESASSAISRANTAILAESHSHGAQMGSTVVCLAMRQARFGLLWAGDSRGYRLRDGALTRLTRDHTQPQALLDRGLITAEEALSHPLSHVLSRAVGVAEPLALEIVTGDILPDDVFLLCSDGLYGTMSDEELETILAHHAPGEGTKRLVARCLEIGANDNVTALVVRASAPVPAAAATAQSHEA